MNRDPTRGGPQLPFRTDPERTWPTFAWADDKYGNTGLVSAALARACVKSKANSSDVERGSRFRLLLPHAVALGEALVLVLGALWVRAASCQHE